MSILDELPEPTYPRPIWEITDEEVRKVTPEQVLRHIREGGRVHLKVSRPPPMWLHWRAARVEIGSSVVKERRK